jgi:uncharacterized protein YdeI (YjbR/CyaY-like superfamily)
MAEEVVTFAGPAEFEAWLAEHHDQETAIWLKIAKKGSGHTTLTAFEAVEVGLCYGWISSLRRAHDEEFFLQRYSRRRPGSPWSKVNVDLVAGLLAAGRMRPPGLADVEAAQVDGRWQAAYESQKTAEVPPDLAAELDRNERAREAFAALGRSDRYAVILPLLKARTAAGRAAALAKAVAKLEAAG